MNLFSRASIVFASLFMALALAAGVYLTMDYWRPWLLGSDAKTAQEPEAANSEGSKGTSKVLLSDEAIANLGLKAQAVHPQVFWKTIQVPGMIADRPGKSDRGVVAPVTGIVTKILRVPGETVQPGESLFQLKLTSESLHLTQTELYKATQDIKLAQAQRQSLAAAGGAIPEIRITEIEFQIKRHQISAKAYRQELQNRGFSTEQIDGVAEGRFVNEIPIVAPPPLDQSNNAVVSEVQELKVDLGQQVQAGQLLCLLSNHSALIIEGRAFRGETPLLERSVKERWPVEVDFQEDESADWPRIEQAFLIRHLANNIDPVNRTFAFQMQLENQSRTIEHDGRPQLLWRFRPGQKVRLLVRTGKLDNVFVLPAEAVARDGVESFVFSQNVNTFERKPVRVVFQNRQNVVVANDGSFVPGSYLLQNGAAQLNRIAKTQSSSVPRGYHVHADGSLHKNEDEGK